MEKLYVLKLENDKYYVGKTRDLETRINAHKKGNGAEWTKQHRVIKILETHDVVSEHDETNLTKELMKKHGVDNVRGGAYCQVKLTEATRSFLEREIRGNTDACFKCGKVGHFVRECIDDRVEVELEPEEEYEEEVVWCCNTCNKEFKVQYHAVLHERRCQIQQKKIMQTVNDKCYRCGRASHYANNCYASSHVKGYEL
jgi:predicted GIY-YIG superfamily endonuclease